MSKIKVCGINDLSCLDSVQKFKPDYLGFITYQNSPRYIDANFLKQAQEFIDDEITPVIVFVNEKISFINEIKNETNLTIVVFSKPYSMLDIDVDGIESIIIAYQNSEIFQT